MAADTDFYKEILLSDEAHFCLNGFINKENCRIWSEDNSQALVETSLNPQKVTICCTLWEEGTIGPYFFSTEAGFNDTVNGEPCRDMMNELLVPESEYVDVDDLWFQQDPALYSIQPTK